MTINNEVLPTGPALNGSVNWKKRIRPNDIHDYWDSLFSKKILDEDETIRITAILPYEKNGKIIDTQRTLTEQVRSADDLIELMGNKYGSLSKNEFKSLVGWSISSAVFQYVPADDEGRPVAPNKSNVKYLESFVIDVDAHVEDDKKSPRFHFNSFTENSRHHAAVRILLKLNNIFKSAKVDLAVRPIKAYATGGGLQFIVKLGRVVVNSEADDLFLFIRQALKQKEEFITFYGTDIMGNLVPCHFEFDTSATDIAHTQRLIGTVNPKEAYKSAFSEEIKNLYNIDNLIDDKTGYLKELNDALLDSTYVEENRKKMIDFYIKALKTFKKLADVEPELIAAEEAFKIQDQDENGHRIVSDDLLRLRNTFVLNPDAILHQKMLFKYTTDTFEKGHAKIWKSHQDYALLQQISPRDQAAFIGSKLNRNNARSTSKYISYECPFHPERDPSFAVYQNSNSAIAYARDFHDGETYNAITFLMAAFDKTRTEAVNELALTYGLKIAPAERKGFHKEEVEKDTIDFIDKVNVDDFIYYRLANKNRSCILREFSTGYSYAFDGTRMMSDHVLLNQLGMKNADMELRATFHEKFQEKILINAFEEFYPGKPYTYEKGFVQFVNLWIPGKDYLDIHKLAENIDTMEIVDALALIKEQTPLMYFYLCQITQRGSLEYFVNWMINVAKFKTMSSLPIITSVQGTGKGVFISEVMEHYLNREYVNTVNSEKISSNFNAFMEKSSLIVLDEGDFSRSHEVDNLKFLTGNDWIQIEKKGIDSQKTKKHFNLIMMTNGETPIIHPSNDRRMTYFRGDVTLLDSLKHLGFDHVNDFMDELKDDVNPFWAILVKTNPKKEWSNTNMKDNQFNKQILMMHPFGKLVIKMLEGEWTEIKLQMNENIEDNMVITANLEMIDQIRKEFQSSGSINLTLINKYIKSLNFKTFVSVQQFIKVNSLEKNGIHITATETNVKIHINKYKLQNLISMKNNLSNLFDCYNEENIVTTLAQVNSHKDITNDTKLEKIESSLATGDIMDGLTPIDSSDPLGLNTVQPIIPPSELIQ